MICSECGAESPAMKTVYWRDDEYEEEYALCDGCYAEVSSEVWIVPGVATVWGRCNRCREWCSVRDLAMPSLGGPHGAYTGICRACGEEA